MKLLVALLVSAVASGLAGCQKKEPQTDASQPLQESFQTAEPEARQAIDVVSTSLQAGNYAEATRALAPVISRRNLTAPQKQAVGVALRQINQAVAANPALDTREMYELRAKMFQAMQGSSRF